MERGQHLTVFRGSEYVVPYLRPFLVQGRSYLVGIEGLKCGRLNRRSGCKPTEFSHRSRLLWRPSGERLAVRVAWVNPGQPH
jgi:hypothetical protein